MNKKTIYRILDANVNRLKEALRVIEEVARLGRGHARLSREAKSLRHRVERILQSSPLKYRELLGARDSAGDVGRESRIRDTKKTTLKIILISNFKRAQESARVLEEFSKFFSEKTSKKFQDLRFRIYTLEKELL